MRIGTAKNLTRTSSRGLQEEQSPVRPWDRWSLSGVERKDVGLCDTASGIEKSTLLSWWCHQIVTPTFPGSRDQEIARRRAGRCGTSVHGRRSVEILPKESEFWNDPPVFHVYLFH